VELTITSFFLCTFLALTILTNAEEVLRIFAPPGKLGLGIYKPPNGGIPAGVCTVKDSSPLVGKVQVEDKAIAVDDEDVLSMTGVRITRTDGVNTARSDDEGQVLVRNEPSRPISNNASLPTTFDTTVSNKTKKSFVLDSDLTIAKKRKPSPTQDTILVASSKKSNSNRRMTNNLILSSKTINDSSLSRSPTEDTTITPLSSKEYCGGKNEQYDIIDLTADNTEIDEVINTEVVVENDKIIYMIGDDDDDVDS
jgi:hypothetical protein